MNRRIFLQRSGLGLAGTLLAPASLLHSCQPGTARAHIQGSLHGANHATGHLLRQPGQLPAPSRTLHTDILIVGGGVAGLAARRELARRGVREVLLVELDERVGGNSAGGHNAVSAYPWGAHYLPLPDPRNHELLAFLQAAGTITGYDTASGLPIYNEYHLCHDPEERLLINGHWQQGLVPELGVPAAEKAQIARFFRLIDELRAAVGTDGRDAFRIPLDLSSADELFRQLDAVSFAEYLDEQGFTAPHLRWYLDYCCKDDYGTPAAQTSAWAGLHYFAARKGRAHNATASDVLTWPQGNNFLVESLRQQADSTILPHTLAYELQETSSGVAVLCYDAATRQTLRIEAQQVVLATPEFISRRLMAGLPDATRPALNFRHTPWVVANLTVDGLPQGPGQPLCWDNVLYGTASVGYVNARHQSLSLNNHGPKVITYYLPLPAPDATAARQVAYRTSYDEWVARILVELETGHPGLAAFVQRVDVWVWGHGMIAPTPGFVWNPARPAFAQPWQNKVFFAHTDLSGVSIFEEGFYQGLRAASELLTARSDTQNSA